MPNTKLVFLGTLESETDEHELTLFANINNEIYLEIDAEKESNYYKGFICIDKSTAIKLHRELKKQISFLKD